MPVPGGSRRLIAVSPTTEGDRAGSGVTLAQGGTRQTRESDPQITELVEQELFVRRGEEEPAQTAAGMLSVAERLGQNQYLSRSVVCTAARVVGVAAEGWVSRGAASVSDVVLGLRTGAPRSSATMKEVTIRQSRSKGAASTPAGFR